MTTRRPVLAGLAACVLLLTACDASDIAAHRLPACDETGDPTTFLMSQAVPDAAMLPCVERERLPSTWWLSDLEVDSRGAEFTLSASRTAPTGPGVDVTLVASCDLLAAPRVPTDEPGTERFEAEGGPGGFSTAWWYRYPGACVGYRIRPPNDAWDRFVVDVQRAIEFVDRDTVVARHDEALGR